VDQFPQIARQIQRSSTGVGEDIAGIFVGDMMLKFIIVILDNAHQIFVTILTVNVCDGMWLNHLKAILGAVPLTTLSEAAMPVSYKLMGTSPGDTFDLKSKINMFEYGMMTAFIKVLHQYHRVLGIAVIADGGNLCNGFDGVRGSLYECYIHSYFSSVK
jgi:hypothetical protein